MINSFILVQNVEAIWIKNKYIKNKNIVKESDGIIETEETIEISDEARKKYLANWIKNKSAKNMKKLAKESIPHDDFFEPEETIEINDEVLQVNSEKKARKVYTSAQKAQILDQYYLEKASDNNLSFRTFAKEVGISSSMLTRWIKSLKA